jgi:hypothetical protein
VTPLPDWLVERAALEEVAPISRERIDRADSQELAARIAELQAQNDAELAAYPAAQAMALIEARVAGLRRRKRRVRLAWLGMLGAATAAVVIVAAIKPPEVPPTVAVNDDVRAKGVARLNVYRQAGDHAEHLDEDALVREGDAIQLRYSASGALYGVIASVDGAGAVTLHYPVDDDAPALATALAPKPTSLPNAYVLDNAPRFERFFFITSADPIEVSQSLAALRALAARGDSDSGRLELPAGQHQWSVRLRKPDRQPQ